MTWAAYSPPAPVATANEPAACVGDSLVFPDIRQVEWAVDAANVADVVAGAMVAGDDNYDGAWINFARDATGDGARTALVTIPADAPTPAEITFALPMRSPDVAAETVILEITDASKVVISSLTCVLGAAVASFSLAAAVDPGENYLVRLVTNSGVGLNVQQSAMVGKPSVRITSALPPSAPWASGSLVRIPARPNTVHRNLVTNLRVNEVPIGMRNAWYLTTQSGLKFSTLARSFALQYMDNTIGVPALLKQMRIYVDGELFSMPAVVRDWRTRLVTVSGLPAGMKTIEIQQGQSYTVVRGDLPSDGSMKGCYIVAVYVAPNQQTTIIMPPERRVLAEFGDSISQGYYATEPAESGGGPILRRLFPGSYIVSAIDSGPAYPFIQNATQRRALANQYVAAGVTDLYIEHGINCWNSNLWLNVAAFAAAYEAFLVVLHQLIPGLRIYAQTPLLTGDEAATNVAGNTVPQYREAITTAVANEANPNTTLVDGTAIMAHNAANFFALGIHPTPLGQARRAKALKAIMGLL